MSKSRKPLVLLRPPPPPNYNSLKQAHQSIFHQKRLTGHSLILETTAKFTKKQPNETFKIMYLHYFKGGAGLTELSRGGAGLVGQQTQWKFRCCMFENKIPDDFENPAGHFFRSQKEDMSGQKRTSGHPTLSLCTPSP